MADRRSLAVNRSKDDSCCCQRPEIGSLHAVVNPLLHAGLKTYVIFVQQVTPSVIINSSQIFSIVPIILSLLT
jgi:hypothetical protein